MSIFIHENMTCEIKSAWMYNQYIMRVKKKPQINEITIDIFLLIWSDNI